MIGLLRKDFFNLKKTLKTYLIFLVFYVVLGIVNEDPSIFSTIITIVSVMIPITAMSFDESSKWERYALTMPVSRSGIVFSRYLLALLFLLTTFILSTVFNLFTTDVPLMENFATSFGSLSTGMILLAVIFPIMFKFGVEKGRMYMMLLLFLPATFVFLLPKLGISNVDVSLIKRLFYLIYAIGPLSLILSCFISLSIYRKKEF